MTDTAGGPAVVDGIDVDLLARAIRACDGVADLDGGAFGGAATYLPGRRVVGVQIEETAVRVQVRAQWGPTVADIYTQISAVTGSLRNGRALHLTVSDIELPAGDPGPTPAIESALDPKISPSEASTS